MLDLSVFFESSRVRSRETSRENLFLFSRRLELITHPPAAAAAAAAAIDRRRTTYVLCKLTTWDEEV
jgi:hypothetical protein